MGLLLLDDSTGSLVASRPGAQLPLEAYETGRLFLWHDKVFLALRQELPVVLPPATLAWWSPGQSRLAFYPVPSQVKDPTRQSVVLDPPAEGSSVLTFGWKHPDGRRWAFDWTTFALDNGLENTVPGPVVSAKHQGPDFAALKAKLAQRLGTGVPTMNAMGSGPLLLFAETGWVAVGRAGEGKARLYRLPDLGIAGHYTGALALAKGFVFTWETFLRGYSGAAGLVHVPFAVLAP
jgi:hypothetical protein